MKLGRFEVRSAAAESGEVRERDALREQGRRLISEVPQLQPAHRWAGELGRLARDGWTTDQVHDFINTWPAARPETLVRLLHCANSLRPDGTPIDATHLAAETHHRYEVDDRGRVRARA